MRSASPCIDAGLLEKILGLSATEILERKSPKEPAHGARPAGHGRLPTRQDEPDLVRQGGHERLAQPWIEQPSELVRVENEHDPFTESVQPGRGGLGGGQLATRLAFERGEEPSLGRLDRAAVQSEDGRPVGPCLDAERLDKRRLADAGDPVDEHDERAALAEQPAKDVHLVVAPNQPSRLLVDQLANGLGHRVILRRPSITRRSAIEVRVTWLGPSRIPKTVEVMFAKFGLVANALKKSLRAKASIA